MDIENSIKFILPQEYILKLIRNADFIFPMTLRNAHLSKIRLEPKMDLKWTDFGPLQDPFFVILLKCKKAVSDRIHDLSTRRKSGAFLYPSARRRRKREIPMI